MQFKNYVLIVLCLGLGFMSFQAWNAYVSMDRNTIYASAYLKEKRALDFKIREMRERLSYMVFAKERKQSQVSLINTLQRRINQTPWSANLWRDYFLPLTELEPNAHRQTRSVVLKSSKSEVEALQTELDWVFSITAKMNKWNRHERFLLINRCVEQTQRTSTSWLSLCQELLNKVWAEPNRGFLLRDLKVQLHELDDAFDAYSVLRPPWMQQ